MRRTVLSGQARDYLRREAAYLRRHDVGAAQRFSSRIASALGQLSKFENLGSPSGELPLETLRRLVVGDYLIFYEADRSETRVLFIRHGRQAPTIPTDRSEGDADPEDFEEPRSVMRSRRIVIAGLDPAIHHTDRKEFFADRMDARIKSGHNEAVRPHVVTLNPRSRAPRRAA